MAGKDQDKEKPLTLDSLEATLSKDTKVKLAGLDIDGTHTHFVACSLSSNWEMMC
jgi:hypothetical protein